MNLFTAPFTSLFSLDFYRKVTRSSLGLSFLYLTLLSFAGTAILFVVFMVRGLPEVNRFVDWAKTAMPAMTWTPEGLTVNAPMPYTMTHPKLGPLITFDTTKLDVSLEMMGEAPIFVTSKKVFTKGNRGEVRIFDLTQGAENQKAPSVIKLDGAWLQKLYQTAMPWFIVFMVVFVFIFYFVWKLCAALIYCWLGLLFNFLRHPRLGYEAIFKVSVFVVTPWFLIQLLALVIPPLDRILPPGILGSLIVTGIYLFLAIKKTEEGPAKQSPAA